MTTPRLKLHLLGWPRLELDGRPVETDTRKAVALAAYLAVTGELHNRAALAALLWPDVDSEHAYAALRRTLSALNKAIEGVGLVIDRDAVRAEPAELWLDVAEFRDRHSERLGHGHGAGEVCPRCLPPLAAAAELYREDFMAGFSLRDSPAFDEWQFFQAEALRRMLAGILEKLVFGEIAHGDTMAAASYARRWLALDALHEPAHAALMRIYADSGQRAAALRQYQECARVLEAELGVAPLPDTTRLYDLIRDNRLPPGIPSSRSTAAAIVTAPPPPAASPAAVPPLVGREAEWQQMAGLYSAIGGDGHWIVVEGEAGIGKTRLAEAWLEDTRARGVVTLAARCYEGEVKLAFSPVVEVLRAGLAQAGPASQLRAVSPQALAEAARLVPQLAGPEASSPLDSVAARARFFEGVGEVLLAMLGGRQPGVLFVDDAQWADESSVDLLAYLVRRLRGRPFCLLTTWRDDQLPPGLRRLAGEALRAGAATRLALPRLDRPAVTRLVSSARATSGPQDMDWVRLTDRLYRESEGLPLLVVEYLAALGRGTDLHGDWPLPMSARELFASRLSVVDEASQQLLGAAAVIGRAFDFDTLQAASGRSEDETADGLERLVAHGIIRELHRLEDAAEAPERLAPGMLVYDFSHAKLRSLVYDDMGQGRRRLLHRRTAEAMARPSRMPGREAAGALSGLIADHYWLGGRPAEAAEHFKLAGDHARSLYANAEALAHYRSALEAGYPNAAVVREAIGDLLTLQGDYTGALAAYAAAAANGDADGAARLDHKAGLVHLRRGEWDLAEARLTVALAALGDSGSPAVRSRYVADWSLIAFYRGDLGQALERAGRALELAERAADPHALAQAHNILGVLHSRKPDLAQARYHLEQAVQLAERLDDPSVRVGALNNLALVAQRRGDLDEARRLTEAALAAGARLGDRHREAALHNNLADLLHTSGRTEEAMAHLKQAVALFAEVEREAGDWQPEIWKLTEW